MTTSHPTFVRCLAVVSAAGSTAKTVRGVVRYLRDNPAIRRDFFRSPRPQTVPQWKASENARKSDPDAKRARTDKNFRRRYLAGLLRQENAVNRCDASSITEVAEYYMPGTIASRRYTLAECARLRTIATGKADNPTWGTVQSGRNRGKKINTKACEPKPAAKYGITLQVSESTARKVKAPLCMRGKDADVLPSKSPSHVVHTAGETEWKNGKPKRYTRATNDNFVRSLAVMVDPQTVDYLCHDTTVRVTLPSGVFWSIDATGLKAALVSSPGDDFHPSAADLLRANPGEYVTVQIHRNRETRLQYAAEHAAELADVEGVYVCVADSLRAGNCRVGTLDFAKRHHLDPARHYEAPELLAQANGDVGRVRLAITAARIRHDRETARGFCELAEHMVSGN